MSTMNHWRIALAPGEQFRYQGVTITRLTVLWPDPTNGFALLYGRDGLVGSLPAEESPQVMEAIERRRI